MTSDSKSPETNVTYLKYHFLKCSSLGSRILVIGSTLKKLNSAPPASSWFGHISKYSIFKLYKNKKSLQFELGDKLKIDVRYRNIVKNSTIYIPDL